MAELTGSLNFKGSLGRIRAYFNSAAKKMILAEKGGASKELIYNHPAFARTRENMSEFAACGKWSHLVRVCLFDIDELNAGYYMGGITTLAKVIQKKDRESLRGHRNIESSKYKSLLTGINFNEKFPFQQILNRTPEVESDAERKRISLTIPEFCSFQEFGWRKSFSCYRFTLVIAQLSDYVWDEEWHTFNPAHRDVEDSSVSVRTEWILKSTDLVDISLTASFSEETIPVKDVTVLVALGVEFASKLSGDTISSAPGDGTMALVACL
jgi:hypothetical protein